jgi:hypothetical protein
LSVLLAVLDQKSFPHFFFVDFDLQRHQKILIQ